MARPEPHEPPEGCVPPEGYVYVVEPEGDDWRVEDGRRCRRAFGTGTKACGAPVAVAVNRSARYPGGVRTWRPRGDWWAYCAAHAYGRWVQNGQVMHWVLRPVEEVGSGG